MRQSVARPSPPSGRRGALGCDPPASPRPRPKCGCGRCEDRESRSAAPSASPIRATQHAAVGGLTAGRRRAAGRGSRSDSRWTGRTRQLDATPAPVRARMPTIVRASGKAQLEMPSRIATPRPPDAGARWSRVVRPDRTRRARSPSGRCASRAAMRADGRSRAAPHHHGDGEQQARGRLETPEVPEGLRHPAHRRDAAVAWRKAVKTSERPRSAAAGDAQPVAVGVGLVAERVTAGAKKRGPGPSPRTSGTRRAAAAARARPHTASAGLPAAAEGVGRGTVAAAAREVPAARAIE